MREEEEEAGDKGEAQESSKGEDIKTFMGPVGQPICPLCVQVDSPLRTVIGCLQATIYQLIPLTPPPSSTTIIPILGEDPVVEHLSVC